MVERLTEKVKVTLVDGKETEVLLYTTIPFRKKQQITNKLFDGVKGTKEADIESQIELQKLMLVTTDIAEVIWADKNYTLDDVEADSLSGVMNERVARFLKGTGLSLEARDNTSSTSEQN